MEETPMQTVEAKPRRKRRPDVKPRAGETFRAVARLQIAGQQRRKLLALIAAYADAGERSPRVKLLAATLGVHPGGIDSLLHMLVDDGLLVVRWGDKTKFERNAYTVLL